MSPVGHTSQSPGPPPASGAWKPGDPAGRRRFVTLFEDEPLRLEAGGSLGHVRVAYETWGELDPDGSNAVLVEHALTGDSHACGPAEPGHPFPGWWDGVVGPGKGIDTLRWFVVCPNVLGGCQGTTGPSSLGPAGRPFGSRFPLITIRDQVAVEAALAGALGIERWAMVVGGSMGGMRALEWAVGYPNRVASAAILACGSAATAEQVALCSLQLAAIRSDPAFRGGDYYYSPDGWGPHRGMGWARRLGHLSYRSEIELQARFGRRPQEEEDPFRGGRYAVESYLDHHAAKLAHRFDANSYMVLTEAMNHHDIGRGRGGIVAALARVEAEVTVVGIDTDRLYPLRLQRDLTALLPERPKVEVVTSLHGHDAFLIESESVGRVLQSALERITSPIRSDREGHRDTRCPALRGA
ncbi:MAG: homoserine O-acetyltransferase [Actinomycetota bacterium]